MAVAFDRHGDEDPQALGAVAAEAFGHETTRYLCGAAYTDAGFRDAVLTRGREGFRARAPEVGVDVAMVTDHCRRALRSKAVRDLVLCPLSVVVLLAAAATYGSFGMGLLPQRLALICGLGAIVITAWEAFSLDGLIRRRLTREGFRRQHAAPEPHADSGNLVVYSGFSPFVGSGSDLGGWSFAVDLERARDGVQARPLRSFELADLYRHIDGGFKALRLPNLQLSRKLFVSGRAIRGDRRFLPDVHKRPVSRVDEALVESYASGVSNEVRYYLCVEVVDWSGELAVTQFIRFRKLSSKLFVEFSAFLLPPLRPAYYDLDKVHPRLRFKDGVRILAVSVVKSWFLQILAPLLTFGRLLNAIGLWGLEGKQRKAINEDLLFDYGCAQSLREMAAGKEWRVYFQKLDKEMHHKILQQQMLDSLVDFLDDHGVDTSEIKERTVHILNNGVIVSGGSINAQGMAVGEGAQAKVANAVRRTREKVSA